MGNKVRTMRVLDEESVNFLNERFKELENDVSINLYVSEIIQPTAEFGEYQLEYIRFTKQLLEDIASLSNKIKLNVKPFVQGKNSNGIYIRTNPTVTIGEEEGYKIVFSGSPLGYEASQLVETIILVSRRTSALPEDLEDRLQNLGKEIHIMTFVTPSCPYCPSAVLSANQLAIAGKGKVVSEGIEAEENMELSMKWGVEAVPLTIINEDERYKFLGVQPIERLIEAVEDLGK